MLTNSLPHFRNIANVQSPGSQSSKGTCSSDQDYMHSSKSTSEIFDNFITNNYANNYYVADGSNSAGSVDGLGLDEIDEIDTNNMAIYSADLPVKKERRTGGVIINTSVDSSQPKQAESLKEGSTEVKSLNVLETPKVSPSSSLSLLLPNAAENINELNSADADLMLNILGEPTTSAEKQVDASGQMVEANVPLNIGYDETSQVSQ